MSISIDSPYFDDYITELEKAMGLYDELDYPEWEEEEEEGE